MDTQHIHRMDEDREPDFIMKYQPYGKRSQGRPLWRLLDCHWDRYRSQRLNPCKLYDDDDDDDDDDDIALSESYRNENSLYLYV